jgi:hypothetical protein
VSDDPRWIDTERVVMQSRNGKVDAAIALLNVGPTTRAGLMALVHYAVAADIDG